MDSKGFIDYTIGTTIPKSWRFVLNQCDSEMGRDMQIFCLFINGTYVGVDIVVEGNYLVWLRFMVDRIIPSLQFSVPMKEKYMYRPIIYYNAETAGKDCCICPERIHSLNEVESLIKEYLKDLTKEMYITVEELNSKLLLIDEDNYNERNGR